MSEKKIAKAKETDPLLVRAWKALKIYEKATGAVVCVLDQDLLPIKESFTDLMGKKNTCVQYCYKYAVKESGVTQLSDMRFSPCNMLHVKAVKEAHRFGGSHIYICEIGFMFWTSPLYSNGRFAGALVGSGCFGVERKESMEALYAMSRGSVSMEELEERANLFSRCESERIKALAELLLICAEYLSTGDGESGGESAGEADQEAERPGPSSAYPLDKERLLLAALRRGDHEARRKILDELLDLLFYANQEPFKYIQFRAIELVVLLSRAAMKPGNPLQAASANDEAMLETNNRYLRCIQEAKNVGELADMLHIIVERMSTQIFSFQGMCHASALRKAERFIWENYTRKISLQEISAAAGLSAPYFSTVFKEEMGENLSSYLNRLRVEKAEHMLTETGLTLNEIASACGFEDQSWFSKIFKSFTGISPGRYRGSCCCGIQDVSGEDFSDEFPELLPEDSQTRV
jgi:AraC-like DNA-binding protein/ligand-binding sensor protein